MSESNGNDRSGWDGDRSWGSGGERSWTPDDASQGQGGPRDGEYRSDFGPQFGDRAEQPTDDSSWSSGFSEREASGPRSSRRRAGSISQLVGSLFFLAIACFIAFQGVSMSSRFSGNSGFFANFGMFSLIFVAFGLWGVAKSVYALVKNRDDRR